MLVLKSPKSHIFQTRLPMFMQQVLLKSSLAFLSSLLRGHSAKVGTVQGIPTLVIFNSQGKCIFSKSNEDSFSTKGRFQFQGYTLYEWQGGSWIENASQIASLINRFTFPVNELK